MFPLFVAAQPRNEGWSSGGLIGLDWPSLILMRSTNNGSLMWLSMRDRLKLRFDMRAGSLFEVLLTFLALASHSWRLFMEASTSGR
ncbi:hypothetical protein DdX_08630 [Ditylenchus destructor]|uniref:Uncharacterized protein n=1 Tax=Ditylenchus destructor TaxID=166010 RepID=A0AAD4R7E1_9BILA|nr:hypothetical protein DdX_08630 [Ditylenchus destructor]